MAKDFELLSKNYEEARPVTIAGAAVVAGQFVTMEDIYGFYLIDGAIGDDLIAITKADRVKVDKTTAETWKAGEALYWVAGTGKVSNVASTNILIGYANEAAAATTTTGIMNFDGHAAFEKA